MKRLLPAILFLLISLWGSGQGIKGRITDINFNPVAYANIYVPALKTGTTSNMEGLFELKLPSGDWNILFQYLGYKTVTKHFSIGTDLQEVSITLQPQNVQLGEITVLASGEDPAYYVMRHAIAMAPYYDKQVAEYGCRLYLKGNGIVYDVPALFRRRLKKEGIVEGKPFIMESLNKIHFELPDKLDQQVISMHSSGDDQGTDPMPMITTSLYNVSKYGIVSPVGKEALKVYRFELSGVFEDQGKQINKIKVIPKNKGQKGTFEGFINIVDGYWNIHSAYLKFNLPFIDVTMRQIYSQVDTNTWMPTSLNFDMDAHAMGFGAQYTYIASFSDYQVTLNRQLDHSFLEAQNKKEQQEATVMDSIAQSQITGTTPGSPGTKNQQKIASLMNKEDLSTREMYKLQRIMDKETERTLPPKPLAIPERVKVSRQAVNNDSAYWAANRPVPLTGQEKTAFGKKDSVVSAHETPPYQDSVRHALRKFHVKDIFAGRTYQYGEDSTRFRTDVTVPGILVSDNLMFNTVDGFNYTLPFSFSRSDTLGRKFNAESSVTWAFSRKVIYGDLSFRYRYNGIKQSWVSFSGGRRLNGFKQEEEISPFESDLYTLFFERNLQKFYEARFMKAGWGTEIRNGLNVSAEFGFSNRNPVTNHSSYKVIDVKDRDYTPNIPEIPGIREWQLEESNALTGDLKITYVPHQYYKIRKQVKYPRYSEYPEFSLLYRRGLNNLLGSDVRFDLLELTVKQQLQTGFDDYLNYRLQAGQFLNNDRIYAPDYKFFNSNDQLLAFSDPEGQFWLPDYYKLNSRQHYIHGYASFDTDKFFLKRFPLIRNTLLRENLKLNYMATESVSDYLELSYGLKGILFLIDVDVTVGFQNWEHEQTGLRIFINLERDKIR